MEEIQSNETIIIGKWIFDGNSMQADSACKRIDWLIQNNLKAIKTDESGWDTLYQDQKDKRYWLHYYPKSEMNGGGPPALKAISDKEASQMFGVANAT